MRRLLLLGWALCSSAAWAAGEDVRLILSIGSNYGAPDDAVLQFAEKDAERIRNVFVELGAVEPSRAVFLPRATAQAVRARFSELKGRVSELHEAQKTVSLIVFVSAHGKNGKLHLSGTELSLDELRRLARDTGADLRVQVVDACESGQQVKRKGARRGPAYQLHTDKTPLRGEVFISSSGVHEPAQEWDVLGGSLFTHHWLTGLRGEADTDADGRVTLMEAFTHASRRTVAESIDQGQHPSFDLGVVGSQDFVLTEPRRSRGQVVLGEAAEGRFVLVSQPRPDIVAEVYKQRGRPLALAVSPGRYVLRHTSGRRVALQEIDLPWGGRWAVDMGAFRYHDFSEVAMKGTASELRPHAVVLHGGGVTPPILDTPLRWAVGASYRFSSGRLWGGIGGGWGRSQFRAVGLTTYDQRMSARLSGGYRFWAGPVILMPGLSFEPSLLRQSFIRDDEERIRRSYGPLPDRNVWGAAFGPEVRMDVPLPGPFFAQLTTALHVRYLPTVSASRSSLEEDAPSAWSLGADGQAGVGVRF